MQPTRISGEERMTTPKQRLIEAVKDERFPDSECEVNNRARGHNEAISRCLELIEEILP